jgi:peptidyl-prolyl cis-trans isomerase D
MLDRMRRRQNLLKWVLGIVVVAFIFIYVPAFLKPNAAGATPDDALATVDGRPVLIRTYQRLYNQQVQSLRNAYGDQFNDQMIQQFGLGQRILQQLLDDEAVQAEARRLGLHVSDQEVQQRIMSIPAFQVNGQFMGMARYEQFLRMQRPPIQPSDFEADVRRQLISEKLQTLVTGWVQVEDADVLKEFNRRNEKVKLELSVFTANQFRNSIQPTDAELKTQFSADPEKYRIPEKRRVKYLALDGNALKARMTATPEEIAQAYQENKAMFSTPEQVRASHILFKTEGKDKAAVRKQAEAVLAKVKAGGDFAALAKQYSDDTSKDNGGDLDYFGHGKMVKPFDDAAWALEVGQTSGLVESEFGFHIIKLTDKKPAMNRTLDQVRPQLEDQIKSQKAQVEARKKADELTGQIKTPADLDKVASAQGLVVSDSGLFARDEPMAGLGFAPAVAAKAFELQPNQVSDRLETQQGFAWITVVEVKPSALPTLDQVKDKVRDDVVRLKAVDVAKAKAATMAQAAKGNFAAAAKAAGVDVKTTELIARGTALPEIGVNQQVEDVVFKLKQGETSGPISTDNAVVVVHVKEKQDPKPADFDAGKEQLKDELRNQKQTEFFAAYMGKARDKFSLTYNQAAIQQLFSGAAPAGR